MSRRSWLIALLGLTLLRLLAAALLPPAPDEAYYWVWGRALAPGYYDHPPMVALWTALGSLLAGDTPLGLRLLGPLGVAVASLLLARAGDLLFPGRQVGPWGAAVLNATLLFGAGSVLMTPDTPLLVFWCAAIWALAKLRASGEGRWWLAFGLLAGCALLSKYTAVLLGAGVLIWLLVEPGMRSWFGRWQLWAGGALALLVFTPVILWNASHGWASFAKQGGRAGSAGTGSSWRYLAELIGGQAGLATPIVFLLCIAGTAAACSAWYRRRDANAGLLAALTLPAAALFVWQATGSRVQGNWPAILYPTACLAAAACLGPRWLRWRRPAVALGLGLTVLVLVQAAFAPLPLPRRSDPTLARLAGWAELAEEAERARRGAGAAFLAAEEYGLASELALHLSGVPVIAVGDRWDLFDLPAPVPGEQGLLLRSLRRDGLPLWPGAEAVGEVVRSRKGIPAEGYRLYRVVVPAGPGPDMVVLPQRR
ncbi:glycosyltransferase family 39 protein [Roseomonas sp. KE0001]|uniref:glycosyltransferase family 39 protein n=1 Tax=Roseomonas sp. KE0001 TaxID=2479201 RepID=UPI0018E025B5|nr:glycosyltransferase family 39 protein [Roseomonas sp. KE0001]MBI0432832.1 UDP-phosphomannose--protein mannosyltransferase [Roseomonas sp. KE0001]